MKSNNILHISPKDAYAQYLSGEAIIIDVREHNTKKVLPKLKQVSHIPMSELETKINTLPSNKPVYVLSERGHSGANAVSMLKQAGFVQARDIYEGIRGWAQYGLPVEEVA